MTFKIFYKNGCPYCEKVENTLNEYDLKYKKYVLDKDFTRKEFYELFGEKTTFPQVFHKKNHIGGSDDTIEYIEAKYGEL